jgi:hypothetical protein
VGSFGRLTARGYDTYQPHARSRPWAALGAGAQLSAALWPRVELALGAELLRPLWRDRFAFLPQEFHRVPAWCFSAQLGLGLRFP